MLLTWNRFLQLRVIHGLLGYRFEPKALIELDRPVEVSRVDRDVGQLMDGHFVPPANRAAKQRSQIRVCRRVSPDRRAIGADATAGMCAEHGLEMIGRDRLQDIEPHCSGLRAIWFPATGVTDYSSVAAAFAADGAAESDEIRI
jgi:hypothetical protein